MRGITHFCEPPPRPLPQTLMPANGCCPMGSWLCWLLRWTSSGPTLRWLRTLLMPSQHWHT